MMLDRSFWSGKRVFVTGHTGFKGGWLSLVLNMMGSKVIGYSLEPSTEPNLFSLSGLSKVVAVHHIEDIVNRDALQAAVSNSGADVLIHMAAQPIVSEGFRDPYSTFNTNVMGTINFLDAYRSYGKGVALVVSSDKCYNNNNDKKPLVETDALGGKDPYSASKAGTEMVTECWRTSFFGEYSGLKVASVRAGNVVGGGDWSPNRLLPDLADAFAHGRPASIRNPIYTRPWQFVLEPVVAYLKLCEKLWTDPGYSRPWNIGPKPEARYSVAQVADLAVKYWPGKPAVWKNKNADKPFAEAQYLSLDSSDFSNRFNWSCMLSIEETIEKTMKWYFNYYSHGALAAHKTTMSQIEEYLCLNSQKQDEL